MPPRAILVTGWLFLVVCAYPGQLGADSFEYLRQARTRFFSDANSPAICTLWRALDLIVAGPTGMLLVQSAMFVIGVYWILHRTLSPRPAAWATVAVVAFPPVLAPMTAIWSHSMMAGFLVLGVGALLSERRRTRLGGLAALLVATAVQPSALFATLPIAVLMLAWGEERRHVRAAAVWLAITAGAFGINAVFAKQPTHLWHSTLASYDLAGTFVYGGAGDDALAGTGLREDAAAVRAAYTPSSSAPIAALWQLPADGAVPDRSQRDALARAARQIVLDHPGAYLRHRLAVFGELLWIGDRYPATAIAGELPSTDDALKFGVPARRSGLQDAVAGVLTTLADTPLFAPWTYLVIALILAPLAIRHRDLIALLASGIAFELSHVVTATGPDLRQSHWLIVSTILAVVLLTVRRARP